MSDQCLSLTNVFHSLVKLRYKIMQENCSYLKTLNIIYTVNKATLNNLWSIQDSAVYVSLQRSDYKTVAKEMYNNKCISVSI